eukprot:gene14092-20045_t
MRRRWEIVTHEPRGAPCIKQEPIGAKPEGQTRLAETLGAKLDGGDSLSSSPDLAGEGAASRNLCLKTGAPGGVAGSNLSSNTVACQLCLHAFVLPTACS